jgi:hypothetical protein
MRVSARALSDNEGRSTGLISSCCLKYQVVGITLGKPHDRMTCVYLLFPGAGARGCLLHLRATRGSVTQERQA